MSLFFLEQQACKPLTSAVEGPMGYVLGDVGDGNLEGLSQLVKARVLSGMFTLLELDGLCWRCVDAY